MAKVLIRETCWKVISEEMTHFAWESGVMKEAIVYPLWGFKLKDKCTRTIDEGFLASDIDYFAVSFVLAPPREFCNHSTARAGFKFTDENEEKEWLVKVHRWEEYYCKKHPTLEFGHIHSHPFAWSWTWPSVGGPGTDIARILKWYNHYRGKGLNSCLEIIIAQSHLSRSQWDACCFVLTQERRIRPVGYAEVVADDDQRVQDILVSPCYLTEEGKNWIMSQKDDSINFQFKVLNYGWSVFYCDLDDERDVNIYIPPQFPDCEKIPVQINRYKENILEPAKFWPIENGQKMSIKEIINFF